MNAEDVRSDQRPHGPRDRCLFGCCESVEALGNLLWKLHENEPYQWWAARPWLAEALAHIDGKVSDK